jgi:hypothetical protein
MHNNFERRNPAFTFDTGPHKLCRQLFLLRKQVLLIMDLAQELDKKKQKIQQ